MNLKEELKRLRDKILGTKRDLTAEEVSLLEAGSHLNEGYFAPVAEAISSSFDKLSDISLDRKVDRIIDWYFENHIEGRLSEYGEYRKTTELRNLIEKIAVWYELRYPDYELNRRMYCTGQERTEVDNIMFNDNEYINELFDENADVRDLEWNELYNAKAFINSLPWSEKTMLQRAKYNDIVYAAPPMFPHFHLTPEGIIETAEGFSIYTDKKFTNKDFEGMHITDAAKLLADNKIELPPESEITAEIEKVRDWDILRGRILDAAMYRIIERGGTRKGPRRGFMFAKEFGRNIDIPMMYAVDYSDPGLRQFINEYIKSGGSEYLTCYVDYFSSICVDKKVETVTVKDLLGKVENDTITFYTPEETDLHQRLVNTLSTNIDKEELQKEQVKQLRIQRKLEKSKRNKQ